MSSEEDIRRQSLTLLGVILTDPAALEELRRGIDDTDHPERLLAVLESLLGAPVAQRDVAQLLAATQRLVDVVAERAKNTVHDTCSIIMGPRGGGGG